MGPVFGLAPSLSGPGMTYVVDIVSRALRILRVIDPDEAVEERRFFNALEALNTMIDAWEGHGRAIGWSRQKNPKDIMPTPPELDEAIAFNLAVKLRPEYGKALEPDVIEFAKSGLNLIRTMIAANEYLEMDTDLPAAESSRRLGNRRAFYQGYN